MFSCTASLARGWKYAYENIHKNQYSYIICGHSFLRPLRYAAKGVSAVFFSDLHCSALFAVCIISYHCSSLKSFKTFIGESF